MHPVFEYIVGIASIVAAAGTLLALYLSYKALKASRDSSERAESLLRDSIEVQLETKLLSSKILILQPRITFDILRRYEFIPHYEPTKGRWRFDFFVTFYNMESVMSVYLYNVEIYSEGLEGIRGVFEKVERELRPPRDSFEFTIYYKNIGSTDRHDTSLSDIYSLWKRRQCFITLYLTIFLRNGYHELHCVKLNWVYYTNSQREGPLSYYRNYVQDPRDGHEN